MSNNQIEKGNKREKRKKKRQVIAPSHTKGYYRFSRRFPAVTDSEGYRDNEVFISSKSGNNARRRRFTLLFIVVFVVSFAVTATCVSLTKLPVTEEEETSLAGMDASVQTGIVAEFLTGDVLSYTNVESVTQYLALEGKNAVVIEFKDAFGYIYFSPETDVSLESIVKASDDAADVVADFQDAGFAVFASFACFADDIYARNSSENAIYIMTEQSSGELEAVETLWYDDSYESHAWLSPYSSDVTDYLNSLLDEIAGMGVDGIILTNIVLPAGTDQSELIFETGDEDETTPNEEMAPFVSSVSLELKFEILSFISAACMTESMNASSVSDIFSLDVDYLILDARLSIIPENTVIGDNTYVNPSESPYEFTASLIGEMLNFMGISGYNLEIVPIIEDSASVAEQVNALEGEGIKSYILFSTETD